MGSLGGGGGKSKSLNRAYGFDVANFGPMVGWGNASTNALGNILGLTNQGYWVDPAHDGIDGNDSQSPGYRGGSGPGGAGGGGGGGDALSQYYNSSGGQFQLNQGLDSVNNKFAAMGLSRSGAAMKAMEKYRGDLMSTKLDNYLGHLTDMSNLGLGAGGLITNAGQKSSGGGGGGGLGSIIGTALATLPYLAA